MKKILVFFLTMGMVVGSFTVTGFAGCEEFNEVPSVSQYQDVLTPQAANYEYWECESKGSTTTAYGSWNELERAYTNGKSTAEMTGTLSKQVSNTYEGSLQVGVKDLSKFLHLKYTIGETWGISVSYSESLKGKKAGTYALKWRPVYDKTPVTQVRYVKSDGQLINTGMRKIVNVLEYKSVEFRLIKVN